MTTKTRVLTLTGFICLIVGLILGTIGVLSNGETALKTINAAQTHELTFADLKRFDFQVANKEVFVKESYDDQFHLIYASFDKMPHEQFQVTQKGSELRLVQEQQHFSGLGLPLTTMSYMLNQRHQTNQVTLLVPKGKVLEELSGRSHFWANLHIEDVHVKTLTADVPNMYISNSLIEGGRVSSGHIAGSTLKNVTLEGGYLLEIQDSQIEDAKFFISGNHLELDQTLVKNSTIIQQYESGRLGGQDLTLVNTEIQMDRPDLHLENVTIQGEVNISAGREGDQYIYYNSELPIDVKLALSKESKDTIGLDVSLVGEGQLQVDAKLKAKSDKTAAKREVKGKDKLTLVVYETDVTLE